MVPLVVVAAVPQSVQIFQVIGTSQTYSEVIILVSFLHRAVPTSGLQQTEFFVGLPLSPFSF